MTNWIRSWLACNIVFAIFLALMFWSGGFDNVNHDKVFYFAMGIIFVTVSIITAVFFRNESKRK